MLRAVGSRSPHAGACVALAGTDAHARLGFGSAPIPTPSAIHVPVARLRVVVSRVLESCRARCAVVGRCRGDARRVIDGDSKRARLLGDRCAGDAGRPVVHGDQRRRTATDGRRPRRSTATCRCARRRARRRARRWCCFANGQRVHEVTDGAARGQRWQRRRRLSHRGLHARRARRTAGALDRVEPDLCRTRDARRRRADRGAAVAHSGAHQRGSRRVGRERYEHGRCRPLADPPATDDSPAIRAIDLDVRAVAGHAAPGSSRRCAFPMPAGWRRSIACGSRVSSSAPMRVWVQLRAPVGNTERWGSDLLRRRRAADRRCRRSRVRADRRDVERAAAARSRRLAAVRGRHAEHAARASARESMTIYRRFAFSVT